MFEQRKSWVWLQNIQTEWKRIKSYFYLRHCLLLSHGIQLKIRSESNPYNCVRLVSAVYTQVKADAK